MKRVGGSASLVSARDNRGSFRYVREAGYNRGPHRVDVKRSNDSPPGFSRSFVHHEPEGHVPNACLGTGCGVMTSRQSLRGCS